MSKGDAHLRLFVAAYPPVDVARALLDDAEKLGLRGIRWVPVEQVHLTLHFCGAVPVKGVDGVIESVRHAAHGIGGFALTPRRLIALPGRGAARLVACETDAPAGVMELHRRLVARLATSVRRSGGKVDDGYLPHLTLGRFARGREVKRSALPGALRDERVAQALSAGSFEVGEVRLMRSALLPGGAEHRVTAAVSLG